VEQPLIERAGNRTISLAHPGAVWAEFPPGWAPSPPIPDEVPGLDVERTAQEWAALWSSLSEALNEKAEEQAWCGDFEAVVEPLGFPGRNAREVEWCVDVSREVQVTETVTYTVTQTGHFHVTTTEDELDDLDPDAYVVEWGDLPGREDSRD